MPVPALNALRARAVVKYWLEPSATSVVDKTTAFYIGEAQSIVVTSGTTNAIELVASYETITA